MNEKLPAAEQTIVREPAGAEGQHAADSQPTLSQAMKLDSGFAALPELRLLVGLMTAAIIIAALYFGRDILMPLALAFLLGFVLDPLVGRLKRWGLPRAAAVAVVVSLALGVLAAGGLLLANQVSAISAQLPTFQSNIRSKLRDLRESVGRPGMFDGVVKTVDTVKAEVDKLPVGAGNDGGKRNTTAAPQRVQVEEKPQTAFQKLLSWLEASSGPLLNAGIVLIFVVLVLLDRVDLRDRLLRLWSGSLHQSTDAMDEAGARISKYLTMQLVVNLSYGVPMAAGLWLIGVPGAILWGMVAAVLRFIPYLGPMISAVFPVVLAFAVDPGWSMVLWTIALIVVLELLSNNIIEPWLYGASTGLSAMSLMVSATFWTALWGPVGLVMSTPLTVCLLVIGRHLPRLHFLDVLLGSQPALDSPTRIYQRLLADDVEEAIEHAFEQSEAAGPASFYNDSGVPALRMASSDHASVATAQHRHRVVIGMDRLLDELRDQYPIADEGPRQEVLCVGGKWEVDTLSAKMLAHALSLAGWPAKYRSASPVTAQYVAQLDLNGVRAVCITYFSPQPQVQARHFCRRLRRRWPNVHIVLALWNAPPALLEKGAVDSMGADAVVTSIDEGVMQLCHIMGEGREQGFVPAPIPEADSLRLQALRASRAQDARARPIFDLAARRAVDIFDVRMAMVSLIDEDMQTVHGAFGHLDAGTENARDAHHGEELNIPRPLSVCGHVVASEKAVVVPDIARDTRFAGNPALQSKGLRFYAGVPLRDGDNQVIGTLCLLDVEPRTLSERDIKLLQAIADDVMETLRREVSQWPVQEDALSSVHETPSATVGQVLPAPT